MFSQFFLFFLFFLFLRIENGFQKHEPNMPFWYLKLFFFLFLFLVSCHLNCWIVDVEFGKLQARDLLQHLWTGPISNAFVDVVQGSRYVEVRAVGVTKVNGIFRFRSEPIKYEGKK